MTAARIYFSRFSPLQIKKYCSRIYIKPFTRNLTSAGQGDVTKLATRVRKFVEDNANLMKPQSIFICNGSEEENQLLLKTMHKNGMIEPLPKYKNCWLARTDPADVARVESKTVIASERERETIPTPKNGAPGQLGKWISIPDLEEKLASRLPGCMAGRTMYVIPFSMGPIGSPLAKIGIQVTDSPYVVTSMRIMTRMGQKVLDLLGDGEFVECVHSVGQPLPMKKTPINNWPCNPDKTIISHIPAKNKIASFGSGYGGNSLLGKKCFALRIGSTIAKREGWLAEHMLILGITNPKGEKKYITAAFPSACGKTNLAMMNPTLPGYKIECVGDDIAWMKFDSEGRLRAINPENGFFGVAPGTSYSTNPNAMKTITSNTVFTNVAKTSDGGFYWEGLEKETPAGTRIVSWLGEEWTPKSGRPAAHANSRFCTPASQCPIIDPKWESNEGVPIEAILFGGRRPTGVPLIYEAFDWKHGVFIGAAMRSEATAAAEHKGKVIMHDPFAMRPFFGYNFGHYLDHWLSMEQKPNVKLPRIFHVNWFRKDAKGNFLWPGFGENSRVLEWVFRRCNGEDVAQESGVGYIPKPGKLNLDGLSTPVDTDELFRIPKDFWLNEVEEISRYFDEQVNDDLPAAVAEQLKKLKERIQKLPK